MSFEDRARVEAERRYYGSEYISGDDMMRSGAFVLGALWAREQEPTEAQVLAAFHAFHRVVQQNPNSSMHDRLHAALIASREAE